jgi:ATP-dependent HslUV protease ATP-binding subunit HslU
MIGSTGVGKTEIARRLSKMMRVPFVKVEASKYTEVGFVGRDVESMVRDLAAASIAIVKAEKEEENAQKIQAYIEDRILEKLLPKPSDTASQEQKNEYQSKLESLVQELNNGILDNQLIKIDIQKSSLEFNDSNLPPDMIKVQESLSKMFGSLSKEKNTLHISIREAKEQLKNEASAKLLDMPTIHSEALRRAENGGIIFLDEIDKIAVNSKTSGRNDPSKEGVQRDLLPIVEGSSVATKYGTIKTDHILFIAAGAFHLCKPSDLIPELQGRFPLRVELESLDEETLYLILTQPKNSLLRQYESLIGVEGVTLEFQDDAIRAMAQIAHKANETTENIGARRLHTVLENVLEDISFSADGYKDQIYTITASMVHEKLDSIIENQDLSRYIL